MKSPWRGESWISWSQHDWECSSYSRLWLPVAGYPAWPPVLDATQIETKTLRSESSMGKIFQCREVE